MPGPSEVCSRRANLFLGSIVASDEAIRDGRWPRRVAVSAGAVFVVAGLVKFAFHHWELHAFRSFGLPWPDALEILAGVLETAGGLLLMWRRSVMLVAALLAVTMVVAIISSGIEHGDVIPSLTLAPALLLAMVYLLAVTLTCRQTPPHRAPAAADCLGSTADGQAR
jgi:uncharacterized membrane protein YphA (DoxX/SURF4 family)